MCVYICEHTHNRVHIKVSIWEEMILVINYHLRSQTCKTDAVVNCCYYTYFLNYVLNIFVTDQS